MAKPRRLPASAPHACEPPGGVLRTMILRDDGYKPEAGGAKGARLEAPGPAVRPDQGLRLEHEIWVTAQGVFADEGSSSKAIMHVAD
jgi:hypothetical protein